MKPGVLYARTAESGVNFLIEIILFIIAVATVGFVAINVFARMGMLGYFSPKMHHILTIVFHIYRRLQV